MIRYWCQSSALSHRIVNHIPHHAMGNCCFDWPIHRYRNRATASIRTTNASTNAGDAKVVPKNWYLCFAEATNYCFDIVDVLSSFGSIEQDVMPMRGIEVFNRFQV